MSRIPNCRTDDNYNQKYLNNTDAEFLRGYDWCTEMAVDNFFDNFGFDLGLEDSYLSHMLLKEMPECMKDKYIMEYSFGQGGKEKEERKVETYFDYIRMKVLEWIESSRDELITSMIDSMGEEK